MKRLAYILIGSALLLVNLNTSPAMAVTPIGIGWGDGGTGTSRSFKESEYWNTGKDLPDVVGILDVTTYTKGTFSLEFDDPTTKSWTKIAQNYDIQTLIEENNFTEPSPVGFYLSGVCADLKSTYFCKGSKTYRMAIYDLSGNLLASQQFKVSFVNDVLKYTGKISGPGSARVGSKYPLTISLKGPKPGKVKCFVGWAIDTGSMYGNSVNIGSVSVTLNKPLTVNIGLTQSSQNSQHFFVECEPGKFASTIHFAVRG